MNDQINADTERLLRELLDIGACNIFFNRGLTEILQTPSIVQWANYYGGKYAESAATMIDDHKRCARFVAFGVLSMLIVNEQSARNGIAPGGPNNTASHDRKKDREIEDLRDALRRLEDQDYHKGQVIRSLESEKAELSKYYRLAREEIEVLQRRIQRLETIKEYIAPDRNMKARESLTSQVIDASQSRFHVRVPRRPSVEERRIADSFMEWCKQPGAMISKVAHFARHLSVVLPGMQVKAVHRDMDSPALPIELHDESVVSPAEYWLITSGSQAWLVPQPQNAQHFREIDPCFVGDCEPTKLRGIVPAVVRRSGSVYVLEQEGEIS